MYIHCIYTQNIDKYLFVNNNLSAVACAHHKIYWFSSGPLWLRNKV